MPSVHKQKRLRLVLVASCTTLLAALEQDKGGLPTKKWRHCGPGKVGCLLFTNKRRLSLVLVAATLLAALEQDKGELPTNRKLRTLWTGQSWLPTVYNVY